MFRIPNITLESKVKVDVLKYCSLTCFLKLVNTWHTDCQLCVDVKDDLNLYVSISETCEALSVPEDITPYYSCNSNNALQAILRLASNWTSQMCVNGEWIIAEQSTSNSKFKKINL